MIMDTNLDKKPEYEPDYREEFGCGSWLLPMWTIAWVIIMLIIMFK